LCGAHLLHRLPDDAMLRAEEIGGLHIATTIENLALLHRRVNEAALGAFILGELRRVVGRDLRLVVALTTIAQVLNMSSDATRLAVAAPLVILRWLIWYGCHS